MLFFAPLHLDSEGWVELLFGSVRVGDNAVVGFDEKQGHLRLTWERDGRTIVMGVDPESMKMVRLQVFKQERLACDVQVLGRHLSGLPSELKMEAPDDEIEAVLKLRDIVENPSLAPGVFTLHPPRSVSPEYLGDTIEAVTLPQGEAELVR